MSVKFSRPPPSATMPVMPVNSFQRPPTTEEVRQALERVIGPRTGYVLDQVHGQRKLFNPQWRDFHPPEGSEVFVGRLPRDLFEDELVPPFLQVGPIYELRTMMNFSGTNRGFAFVCYFDRQTALRAVETLNNYQIRRGQMIGVLPSVNNRKLYIGGLRGNNRSFERVLQEWLRQITEGVETIRFYQMSRRSFGEPDADLPLKYAVVTYASHRQAAMARRALIPIKNEVFGPKVVIDWADPNRFFRGNQSA